MEIKRIEVDAKIIIIIQSEKQIDETKEEKAKLLAEVGINSNGEVCEVDIGTKAIYRCHIEE